MRKRLALLGLVLSILAAPGAARGGSPPTTFTYDASGNLTSKTENGVVWSYIYDTKKQLVEVQRDGLLIETYQYDYQGHRIKKAGPDGVTRYVWDRSRILLRTDDHGNTIAKYTYAGNRLLSIEHVSEGTAFYLFDGLGSVVALSKPNGSLAARYSYGAWGNLQREAGECSNSFLFTGHEFDEGTGLYYAKGRYLHSELGRFLTEDPASGQILEPLSLHKYLYGRSNPTRYIDPDGREAMEVTASGDVRTLNGQELYRILVNQEGLSPRDASRIVVLSELGEDIGADRTAAMIPYILGAGELTGILPAERALANPYVQGSLQVVGGTAEVGLGLAAAGTGAGAVASPVLAAHGGDTIGTGIRTLRTGETQETLTHRGMRAGAEGLGADPSTAAFVADLGEVGLVGLAGTGAATAIPSRPPSYFGDLPTTQPSTVRAMVVTESSSGGVSVVPAQAAPGSSQPPSAANRPTWQQSEAYVAQQLEGFGFREQASFVRGQEVRRGLRGSVRPDEVSQLMQLSVDVKNYNLTTDAGRSALVQDVLHQVNSRVANLPSGMRQGLILDARGQTVDPKLLQDLLTRISTRTNGVIAPENIHVEH